jgi:hypothetical protein
MGSRTGRSGVAVDRERQRRSQERAAADRALDGEPPAELGHPVVHPDEPMAVAIGTADAVVLDLHLKQPVADRRPDLRAPGVRRGRVAVVGVDGIEQALAAIKRGAMSATVSQYPYTIGKLGVEACRAAASGRSLPAKVDAPIQVVTRRNVAQAQAKFPEPVAPFASPFAAVRRG